jgi:hypothetical protein
MRPPSFMSFTASRTPNRNAALGIKSDLPIPQRDFEHRLVELLDVGPGVADENVQGAQGLPHLREHPCDVVDRGDVGLEENAFGAALPELADGFLGGRPVLQVVDADPFHAAFGELEGDAPAMPRELPVISAACALIATPPMVCLPRLRTRPKGQGSLRPIARRGNTPADVDALGG